LQALELRLLFVLALLAAPPVVMSYLGSRSNRLLTMRFFLEGIFGVLAIIQIPTAYADYIMASQQKKKRDSFSETPEDNKKSAGSRAKHKRTGTAWLEETLEETKLVGVFKTGLEPSSVALMVLPRPLLNIVRVLVDLHFGVDYGLRAEVTFDIVNLVLFIFGLAHLMRSGFRERLNVTMAFTGEYMKTVLYQILLAVGLPLLGSLQDIVVILIYGQEALARSLSGLLYVYEVVSAFLLIAFLTRPQACTLVQLTQPSLVRLRLVCKTCDDKEEGYKGTNGAADIKFMINGLWTEDFQLFNNGLSAGEEVTRDFELHQWPELLQVQLKRKPQCADPFVKPWRLSKLTVLKDDEEGACSTRVKARGTTEESCRRTATGSTGCLGAPCPSSPSCSATLASGGTATSPTHMGAREMPWPLVLSCS